MAGVSDSAPPAYVLRDIDTAEFGLRARLRSAAVRNGFVLLVGGSSVGKTRSAVEAIKEVLADWWLIHPAGPAEVAALAAAPPSRTVVWLDELQRYLGGKKGLAAGTIRALLNAPGPLVLVGTLWPDQYSAYAALPAAERDDRHARKREVLDLADTVRIGEEFSASEQGRAREVGKRDGRIAAALNTSGWRLAQALAAAPELVAHWDDAKVAEPYAWAVLTAALDAACLGIHAPLAADLLRAVAPGYLTSRQRALAPADWFDNALAYATRALRGAAAALDPVSAKMGRVAGYTPADYLVQHVTWERPRTRIPASTWEALVAATLDRDDTLRLAGSADCLLRYSMQSPSTVGYTTLARPRPVNGWSSCWPTAATRTAYGPWPRQATGRPRDGWTWSQTVIRVASSDGWLTAGMPMACGNSPSATDTPPNDWRSYWPNAARSLILCRSWKAVLTTATATPARSCFISCWSTGTSTGFGHWPRTVSSEAGI